MGIVISLSHHARASVATASGLKTCAGHSKSSGHLSENQQITSSYLRAVKVLASSSSRSKKRQSPAAKRPIVAMLTDREAAYAEAQAMRFDRSSVSMASEDSRNFPTTQAFLVGNFPLAQAFEKSDKSAMGTVDDIRLTIRQVMAETGDGAVTMARKLEIERNYIADFLKGKKRSLSIEVATAISERYSVPLQKLTPPLQKPTSIRVGTRPHLYIAEHMEARGWDDDAMAARMDGIDASAVAKWRQDPKALQKWQLGALLFAFGMEDEAELSRPPAPPRAAHRPVRKPLKVGNMRK